MTMNKVSYDQLEKLKKQWVSTLDAIVDPLVVIDSDYRIIRSNKAFAKACNKDFRQLIGKKSYKVFSHSDKPTYGCPIKETIETRESITRELSNVQEGKFFEVSTQILSEENAANKEILVIYKDRTLANQLKKQLIHSEKLASIGVLAGGIAHELNNPLAGIIAFSQSLLLDIDKSDEILYESVSEIENAAKRCSDIVESLLVYARQNPDYHAKIKDKKADIIDNIKTAIKFVEIGNKSFPTNVEIITKCESVIIDSDKNKLLQIFINIIQNAVQASKPEDIVKIVIEEASEEVIVSIIDKGHGMSPKVLDKIFDPFFSTKPEGEGTGLGLAITLGLLKELQCEIDVKSQENKGTTFTLTLPRKLT